MGAVRGKIEVRGIVQGVGYRPFIHRQVRRAGLRGWVKNTSHGVEITLEGERDALEAFAEMLRTNYPPLAMVESVTITAWNKAEGVDGFRITESTKLPLRRTLISPDIATCDDCLGELEDKNDRRFGYPFLNCTNCGPRFTIIRDVPYDRPNTTMGGFPMCPVCGREYHDIENRRYHAQPTCCPDCGPQLGYCDADGTRVEGDALSLAVETLQKGGIVAVKGLGGFHLSCRCDDAGAVLRLRNRKHREEKPLAIMCRSIDAAKKFCAFGDEEAAVLTSPQRPITLLKKRSDMAHLTNNQYLGVMLPYTPLHHLLLRSFDALVMTSANLSDLPIIKDNEEAITALQGVADGFLLHDRPIESRCDDSLLWVHEGMPYFARRSRGYVPYPVAVDIDGETVLACGGEQKASFCLSRESDVFPSAHIGDLKNAETLTHYEQQITHFEKLFDVKPELLVCDQHPDYLSARYAYDRCKHEGLPLIAVQHHHAHMVSCMADNRLTGKCLGIIWDGTGLGDDGTIWGGEFLVGDEQSYERVGSIRPIPLIGGERAIWEIERIGYALLHEADGISEENPVWERMLLRGMNCPASTGMGRLFDGVCALLGLRSSVSYEGQGAVLLEAAATEDEGRYPVVIEGDTFDWREMVKAIVHEKVQGVETGVIAARFMNTLVEMAVEMSRRICGDKGLQHVVLSGGVFQNQYLLTRLPRRLREVGLTPYIHRRVSCNDEGLSLGQLVIAKKGGGVYVLGSTAEDR
ncbi:MAG: carbamoyltransferase HypF [Eubacteriales bacterium]|nr:carbamoyltransferase HypF [Eubacteriales bacterium]